MSVDVEQIMEQIRARIRDKRGVDYTEDQIRELATVRLEKFLDPKNLRSDLLEQFRQEPSARRRRAAARPTYEFEDSTLYDTHRGLLRTIRRLLNPLLKLFFNPNTLVNVLHQQAQFNRDFVQTTTQARVDRAAWNSLYYEVLHNLVLETTRSASSSRTSRCASRRCPAGSTSASGASARSRASCSTGPRRCAPRARSGPSRAEVRRPAASSRRGVPGTAAGRPEPAAADGDGRRRRRRRRGPPWSRLAPADRVAPACGGPRRASAGDDGGDGGDGGRRRRRRQRGRRVPLRPMRPASTPTDRLTPDPPGVVKIAVVVQRYGADINGGAELHARYIAEHLAAPRRGRGADHLRPRLHLVGQRATRRATSR